MFFDPQRAEKEEWRGGLEYCGVGRRGSGDSGIGCFGEGCGPERWGSENLQLESTLTVLVPLLAKQVSFEMVLG